MLLFKGDTDSYPTEDMKVDKVGTFPSIDMLKCSNYPFGFDCSDILQFTLRVDNIKNVTPDKVIIT